MQAHSFTSCITGIVAMSLLCCVCCAAASPAALALSASHGTLQVSAAGLQLMPAGVCVQL